MKWKHILTALLIVLCLFLIIVFSKAYFDGNFSSVETLQEDIKQFGLLGPLVLTSIQALQVVIPILPGFLGCIVGSISFGWFVGFLCNYIGISLGSIIAFLLARKYGVKLVKSMFSEKKYEKYSNWAATSKSYVALLFIAMLLPVFPDDFLCYFSGLTNMKTKKFILIIILGKPWCLLIYSLMFGYIK